MRLQAATQVPQPLHALSMAFGCHAMLSRCTPCQGLANLGSGISVAPWSGALYRERDALPAPDAQRHDPALQAVAPHGMQQARRQHGAGGANRVAVRDGAALDVHDVFAQAQLAQAGKRDRGEGLVDLDALDVADLPPGTLEGLPHGG